MRPVPDSFPCAARECSHDAPASRYGTQARPHWVTTWHVGTRKRL